MTTSILKKSRTGRCVSLGLIALVLMVSGCSNAAEPLSQAAKPTESKDRTYRALNGSKVISLITSDELEVRQSGENLVCKYTEKDNKLRIVMSEGGTTKALYYNVTSQGLVGEQGEILYEPGIYKKNMTEIAELKVLMKKFIESGESKELEAKYPNGPPAALAFAALQDLRSSTPNEKIGQLITMFENPEIFQRARIRSMTSSCKNNLRQLSGATDQYHIDHNGKMPSSIADLCGDTNYIKKTPVCPAGGTYQLGPLGVDAKCSTEGHTI